MFHSYVSLPDVYANFSSTKIHPKKQENFKKKNDPPGKKYHGGSQVQLGRDPRGGGVLPALPRLQFLEAHRNHMETMGCGKMGTYLQRCMDDNGDVVVSPPYFCSM